MSFFPLTCPFQLFFLVRPLSFRCSRFVRRLHVIDRTLELLVLPFSQIRQHSLFSSFLLFLSLAGARLALRLFFFLVQPFSAFFSTSSSLCTAARGSRRRSSRVLSFANRQTRHSRFMFLCEAASMATLFPAEPFSRSIFSLLVVFFFFFLRFQLAERAVFSLFVRSFAAVFGRDVRLMSFESPCRPDSGLPVFRVMIARRNRALLLFLISSFFFSVFVIPCRRTDEPARSGEPVAKSRFPSPPLGIPLSLTSYEEA